MSLNQQVSAIIVSAAKHGLWDQCVESLLKQTVLPGEVILIDVSADSTLASTASARYPGLSYVNLKNNPGYGAALDAGIALARGEFILCLNDDVRLDSAFIEKALAGFAINDRIGSVSGKILRPEGKIIDSAGLYLSIFATAAERGYAQKDRAQFDKPGFIAGVSGAAAFLRRSMLEDIKIAEGIYFDPRMRYFYEDLDIALRSRKHSWKAYYVPQSIAYHARGASLRKAGGAGKGFASRFLDDDLFYELLKNRYLALRRSLSVQELIIRLPFLIGYEFFLWANCILLHPRVLKKIFCADN